MDPTFVTAVFFGSMLFALFAGIPIAIALGGTSAILVYLFWSERALSMLVIKAFGNTSSFEFIAIPLFVFMANMLQRSQIAEDVYDTMHKLLGELRGGLAMGTIVVCTIFAAMAGISGAATVAMGIIAIPAMLRRRYPKALAVGSVAAGGSLGILIPPSVTMIVYGLVAQVSVGQLYAAGLLPGLLLAGLFIAYIALRAWLQPNFIPTGVDRPFTAREKVVALKGIVFPLLLVVAVLGSILTGLTSVSEAAAVGAVGSIVAALLKRGFDLRMFKESAEATLLLSCLIFWIIIGAGAFSTLYTAMGAATLINSFVLGLEVSPYLILLVMMLILVILGMVLDTVGIIMITVPVFAPLVAQLGFDPIWFGILFIINMEIGFITPPFGYNLFYLRGVAPPEVSLLDIYRSIVPFVLIMFLGLGLCVLFPQIVLVLPELLFR